MAETFHLIRVFMAVSESFKRIAAMGKGVYIYIHIIKHYSSKKVLEGYEMCNIVVSPKDDYYFSFYRKNVLGAIVLKSKAVYVVSRCKVFKGIFRFSKKAWPGLSIFSKQLERFQKRTHRGTELLSNLIFPKSVNIRANMVRNILTQNLQICFYFFSFLLEVLFKWKTKIKSFKTKSGDSNLHNSRFFSFCEKLLS